MRVEYSILDPTGNVTILVATPVGEASQPAVAAKLMELEPTAEQVGFLSEASGYDIALRMAGGEFCGNASMCAAVCFAREESRRGADSVSRTVKMRVSGALAPVMARVKKTGEDTWRGTVEMPRPLSLKNIDFPGAGRLPVVMFDGISHVICEGMMLNAARMEDIADPKELNLCEEMQTVADQKDLSSCEAADPDADRRYAMARDEAEACAPKWCRYLGAEALGLMFLNEADSSMTPLVYVPAAGTLFWENSCASGTTACGAYLAEKSGGACSVTLRQPGGSLLVEVRPDGGLSLSGTVRFCGYKRAEITV